jgi:hypothetical protein
MKRHTGVALAALLAATHASACGPYFPEVLLDNRAGTLTDLPEGTFTDEAARLVPVPLQRFKPVERADWLWTPQMPTRDTAERAMLGDSAYERAQTVRHADDAALAYAISQGLPEDARRYLAGAVAFDHGDMQDAARRFASVLELPVAERPHFGVWAAFMLGRVEALGGNAHAAAAFQQVRALVAAGAADPLGMAIDSYGEEARLYLASGDDAAAIALYAQQAALGSRFGLSSLLFVARALVADPQRLERGIADPLTQRLVATYLLTRSGELALDPAVGESTTGASAPAIRNFLDAIDKRGLDHVEGAGRLAALAYRSGRYDLAGKFAAKGADGLAAWVRAKLALRAGDANAAAIAYAQAAKAFPATQMPPATDYGDWNLQASTYCRVEGEAGTLALARGEYVGALEHLYAAAPAFWLDAAFVAERVLTLDELQQFVDTHAATPVPLPAADAHVPDRQRAEALLRALLARRLLRSERFDDALAYFDDAALKAKAANYAAARQLAASGGRIARAEQWYRAATLAREDGMDLLGYETDPDNQYFGGGFEPENSFGYAPSAADGEAPAPPPVLKIDTVPLAAERERVAATVAQPDLRFHYRYVAADFAARAADLVPQRSQAYAAMLCKATGWLLWRNPSAASVYYDRYVENGPYVPWAANFGMQCEEPDFAGAARRLHAERVAAAKRFLRKAFPYALGAVLGIVLAGVWWRRRDTRSFR